MKITPIIFSAGMIRTLLDGLKTQTRRVVKPQPSFPGYCPTKKDKGLHWASEDHFRKGGIYHCPYGRPSDLLWVRESCYAHELSDCEAEESEEREEDYIPYGLDGVIYKADDHFEPIKNSIEASDSWVKMHHYRGKRGATVPSIHMPRWASRLTLRITNIKMERVQEINSGDAMTEGFMVHSRDIGGMMISITPLFWFEDLWNSINEKRGQGWSTNPWVWVIEFEVVKMNVDYLIANASYYSGRNL